MIAMLFKPMLASKLSGSVGGFMASRHRGSAHFQLRGLRSNRRSQQQQVVRGAVSGLTALWESALSEVQREGWRSYAVNVAVVNRIGESRHTTGMMMYVRANAARLQVGFLRRDDAPTTFDRGVLTVADLLVAFEGSQSFATGFAPAGDRDPWQIGLGSVMIIYGGRPQNSGIVNYRGSYRFAGRVVGNPTSPPNGAVTDSPFPFVAGQRLFVRYVVSYLDGRYTVPIFQSIIAQ